MHLEREHYLELQYVWFNLLSRQKKVGVATEYSKIS